ncbi:Reverse transcriptase RNA-dependent DNA polymerase [Trinorchestia longiramus]|nr:Reverse transcriptase RNA-dependent DNA polymerase [Trinorchestia longiramus]
MSFEKEPSKGIECVPCSFPQEEKHEDSEGELELHRSTRNRAAPDTFGEWLCFAQDKFDVPANVEEPLHGPESKLWKAAMEEEMASMNINNVWSLVKCPKNKKPIRCKWIFKKKTGPDGNVCSYKARLVAQGCVRKFGVDYDETFSPVVRFESVLAVLALVANNNLQLHHIDVATAFLNDVLSEEIYLTQSEGFVSEGNENLVCRLNKSLYGLKQSPKCWNTALDGHLKQLGFKQFKNDACIYTHVSNKGLCIIAMYVDDIIIASNCIDEINEIKSCLSAKYKMKDLGKLSYFLGTCVALSTAEAEYVALAGAAQEAICLKQLLDDLEFKTGGPIVVNEDNQSAICLAQNPKYHGRSIDRTLRLIAEHYVWPSTRKDVNPYVQHCHDCQASKVTKHNRAALHACAFSGNKFDSVHLNLSNGLIERVNRDLKNASKSLDSRQDWIDRLSIVLPSLRSLYKQDQQVTASEMMYGKTLRLPGDIVNPNLSKPFSLADQTSYAEYLKDCVRQIQYVFQRPTNTSDRLNPAFQNSTYVYVCIDGVKPALTRPYEGPFRVLKRTPKYFIIEKFGKHDSVTINRIKTAYVSDTQALVNLSQTSNPFMIPHPSLGPTTYRLIV